MKMSTIVHDKIHNVIIIGSGPAGYTAAIYLARANLRPLLLEGDGSDGTYPGGLLTTTNIVENFPGFPNSIDGFKLTTNFKKQCENFGTITKSEHALNVTKLDNIFKIQTKNNTYFTKTIIIATGSTPNKLYIENFDRLLNHGISMCAICDGGLDCFLDKPLAVIGGGDSACEEALLLSRTASHVYIIFRKNKMRASKIMIDRVTINEKITLIPNHEIETINGLDVLESIDLKDYTNNKMNLKIKGLFIAIGHTPNSQFISDLVEVDDYGYIITDKSMSTNINGIWAVGDVQDSKYKQAITAAGSGCIAALELERYLSKIE